MSKKSPNSLTSRQAKFLRVMIEGELTTTQIIRKLNLAPHTLRRWMDQPKFIIQWEKTIEFLAMAHRTDAACVRSPSAPNENRQPNNASAPSADTAPVAAPIDAANSITISQSSSASAPIDPAPSPKPLSERERIRTLHGTEAAEAFDRLVQLRLKNQAAAAAARAATTEVDPPDGNASVATTDDSPPSPAHAETTVVVPEVDVQSCAIA